MTLYVSVVSDDVVPDVAKPSLAKGLSRGLTHSGSAEQNRNELCPVVVNDYP